MRYQTQYGLYSVQSQTTLIRTILAVLLTLNIALTSWSSAAAQDSAFSTPAQQILNDVNQARIDNGLPPLVVSPMLTTAAQNHVDDVVANGNWGHYGSDGSNIQLRVARAGYSTSSVSENWVAVSDPGQAIGWWMNDWIHRVNILEPRWDEIGVGAAQASNGYWILVTDFGNIDGGALPPVVESAPVTQLTAAADINVEAAPANGEYAIQGGDTLLGIAIRFGLDWQDIALANDMGENDLLQIGQVIRLPIVNSGGGTQVANTGGAVAGKQVHVIRTGETLWTISARYAVAWQDIAAVNGLGEYDLLQIGQELKLPASLDEPEDVAEAETQSETQAETASNDESEAAAPAAVTSATRAGSTTATTERSDEGARFTQKSAAAPATYTVKSGDTLLAIAIRQDISWQELAEINDLDEDSFLQIGQQLKLPGASNSVAVEVAAGSEESAAPAATISIGRVHNVKSGDTVYAIALQYDVDWQELLQLNGLEEDTLLQLGQELQLP